jgi:hypothetical protein
LLQFEGGEPMLLQKHIDVIGEPLPVLEKREHLLLELRLRPETVAVLDRPEAAQRTDVGALEAIYVFLQLADRCDRPGLDMLPFGRLAVNALD